MRLVRRLLMPLRGNQRSSRALLTSAVSLFSRFVHILVGLISVPLTVQYLGEQEFGFLMTLTATLTMLSFSDFGLGLGVQDRISVCLAKTRYARARNYFYSNLAFSLILSIFLLIIIEFLSRKINLLSLFDIPEGVTVTSAENTVRVICYSVVIGLISGILQRVFISNQQGYLVEVVILIGRLITLIFLYVAVAEKYEIEYFAFILTGLSNSLVVLFAPYMMYSKMQWIRISPKNLVSSLSTRYVSRTLKIGSAGLGAAIAMYIIGSSNQFIIGVQYSLNQAAVYATMAKLIAVPLLILTAVTVSFWPAVTEAYVQNEMSWLSKLEKKLMLLTITISILFSLLIGIFYRDIILIWTSSPDLIPSFEMVVLVIIFMNLMLANAYCSLFLNGLSRFKSQGTYLLAISIAFFVLAYISPGFIGSATPILIVSLGMLVRCTLMYIEFKKIVVRY